jgi:hypothetical protein
MLECSLSSHQLALLNALAQVWNDLVIEPLLGHQFMRAGHDWHAATTINTGVERRSPPTVALSRQSIQSGFGVS